MSSMEIPLHATVAIAGVVLAAAYILFGLPLSANSTPKRKKQKKGSIPGLENIGNSCFLNSILQAISTCPSFVQWLDDHDINYDLKLLNELNKMTKVLNNLSEDFPNTRAVLSALKRHGWVISREEQDAHELFHVLTSTLDEEFKASAHLTNSLLNVSWLHTNEKYSENEQIITQDIRINKSKIKNSMNNNESKESLLIECVKNKESPQKAHNIESRCSYIENSSPEVDVISDESINVYKFIEGCNKPTPINKRVDDKLHSQESNAECIELSDPFEHNRENSEGLDIKDFKPNLCGNLSPTLLNRVGSPIAHSLRQIIMESPFKGYLANRLQCLQCGFKNAERWSSFESLSLSLPHRTLDRNQISNPIRLNELLNDYISTECVSEVTCDGCTKTLGKKVKSNFSKQLTIGKLPPCLCIHIQRTTWLENGSAMKRTDHVAIPDVLDMNYYTYSFSFKQRNMEHNGLHGGSELKHSYKNTNEENENYAPFHISNQLRKENVTSFQASTLNELVDRMVPSTKSNLYKLRAVIVHMGDVFSGHFATYRRGPYNSQLGERWFYTSDLVVREVWPEEVFQASVYMALYEKNLH